MYKFNVIGSPVSQSKSPEIFNFIFNALNIQANYKAVEISNLLDLKEFIKECKKRGTLGLNITMPYKECLNPFINERDNVSKITQSINCIKIFKNKTIGYNNDYFGFKKLIEINKINIKNSNNIVLGSGGSARTIILYLINNNAKNITILARNKETSLNIIENFRIINKQPRIKLYDENSSYKNYNLINCTPIGLKKNTSKTILSKAAHIDFNFIIDINYIYKNDFLNLSYKKIITGETMFVFQAFKSLDIWFESNISDKLDYMEIQKLLC
jgi:shikimate dehydrogenase